MGTIRAMKYEMDESIDDLMIEFDTPVVPPTRYGEIEIPDKVPSIVRRKIDSKGNLIYFDIVNPEPFFNSPETDDVEVNGINIKQLVAKLSSK